MGFCMCRKSCVFWIPWARTAVLMYGQCRRNCVCVRDLGGGWRLLAKGDDYRVRLQMLWSSDILYNLLGRIVTEQIWTFRFILVFCVMHWLPYWWTAGALYRRLGEPQSRSGQVRKISPPPGFDPRTVQPVAQSLYRLSCRAHLCTTGLSAIQGRKYACWYNSIVASKQLLIIIIIINCNWLFCMYTKYEICY